MTRLPRSIADLHGLRARRYVRVSSEEQGWKYGPAGQSLTVDEAIKRLGLLEEGEPFVDEQSAWSKSETRPALASIRAAAAAGSLDVLVVAYFSRWSRDTEVALRIRRELHDAGVVLYFADEDFLSSDESQHERFLQEATAAEIYSLRLSRTIRKTLAAKFERFGDQAGSPGLGFMRTAQPEARLAIDPVTMPEAVRLFERYGVGDLSYRELGAWAGMNEGKARAIVTNPLYTGWAVRHRRSADAVQLAAPWRSSPPVSDELWARVVEVRAARAKVGGLHRARHPHLLAKLVWCACGRAVRADTSRQRNGKLVLRYMHQDCLMWLQESVVAHRLDDPIGEQVSGIRLDAAALVRIRKLAGRPKPPDTELRRAQLERDLRTKAAAHARRELTTEAYLAEHGRIGFEIDALATAAPAAPMDDVDEIVRRLRDIRSAWKAADPAARAGLARAIYRRITVVNGRVHSVALTEEAQRLGLPLLLPTVVEARPAGAGRWRTTAIVRQTIRIEGREEWLRVVRSA